METRSTRTATYQTNFSPIADDCRDNELAQQRLDILLAINSETALKNLNPISENESAEAATMQNPLSDQQAYAYFGILLGVFPPLAIFTRFFMNNGNLRFEDLWILGVIAVVNLITAVVGYFSGKLVGKIVGELEKLSWTKMLLAIPFIGLFWGAVSGAAGGVIIFIFGAIFGAMIGAAVGSIALPIFTVFHRNLKREDKIDRKHFLPLAFGVSMIISAFIVGM